MFITTASPTPLLHPSKLPHQQSHSTVITRALEAHWYLLVYQVTNHRHQRVSQTSFVAWDETLVELLSQIAPAALTGIGRLDRRHGQGPAWGLQWVQALWAPAPQEARATGRLLLQFSDDPQLRDAWLRPVGDVPGRRLLYAACPAGRG